MRSGQRSAISLQPCIEVELQRVIEPIPARPRPTQVLRLTRPAAEAGQKDEGEVSTTEVTT